jgi:hypothetical protein
MRRRYRLHKGGHPQLVLIHYYRVPLIRKSLHHSIITFPFSPPITHSSIYIWLHQSTSTFTPTSTYTHLVQQRSSHLSWTIPSGTTHYDRSLGNRAGQKAFPHPAGPHQGGMPQVGMNPQAMIVQPLSHVVLVLIAGNSYDMGQSIACANQPISQTATGVGESTYFAKLACTCVKQWSEACTKFTLSQ